MKLLTRDTDYAIRALAFIARRGKGVVSVTELVRALKIPRPFLRKILQILNKEGIVRSYKGMGGGFKLSASPKRIFLVDLIEIFQGPFSLNECFFKKNICPTVKVCRLKKKIDAIEKHVIRELSSITIDSILR